MATSSASAATTMQSSSRTWTTVAVAGSAILLLALAFGAFSPVFSAQAAEGQGNQLAGLWLLEAQPEASSGVPPIPSYATITKDGAIVNVDEDGAGVGRWERLRGNTYAVTFAGFLGADSERFVARGTMDLQGDSFSGPFRTQLLDSDGNVFFEFTGTATATRQPVESP